MRKPIDYAQLTQFLLDLGFVSAPTTGNYQVFEHEQSKAVILLPAAGLDEPVDAMHLAAVRSTVVGMGILDGHAPEELFDALLAQV